MKRIKHDIGKLLVESLTTDQIVALLDVFPPGIWCSMRTSSKKQTLIWPKP
ncbi:MAG: hypothetical protein ACNYWU_06165 [Desulfobacterales bacterium]